MQSRILPGLLADETSAEAERILRSCVHCGFCTAVCPTYQLLGDELDGPRGRIYLIKEILETGDVAEEVVPHIDRCLTCRACETACPSGVEYGRLVDIGRGVIHEKYPPTGLRRLASALLRRVVPHPAIFGKLLRVGQAFRWMLPVTLTRHIPRYRPARVYAKAPPAARKVIVLEGCAQKAATPSVNRALEYLLGKQGISVQYVSEEGCCGALDYHLGEHEAGKGRMRRLIDALEPRLNDVESIVSTASGCGVTIKEYPALFAGDDPYQEKASRVSAAVVDASELMADMVFEAKPARVACHLPCTLQHGQGLLKGFDSILAASGLTLVRTSESHLCCGSAGSYSIMQPTLSAQLRDRKLIALGGDAPEVIATANIGCQLHLENANVPVRHWLELLADQVSLLEQPPQ